MLCKRGRGCVVIRVLLGIGGEYSPKSKQRWTFHFIVIFIPNIDILSIQHSPSRASKVQEGGSIPDIRGPTHWKPTTRVEVSKQNISNSVSCFVTAVPCLHDCRRHGPPWHGNWSSRLVNNDRVWCSSKDACNEVVDIRRERHRGTICRFSFPVSLQVISTMPNGGFQIIHSDQYTD